MYPAVREEPEHETAWWRHHFRILLGVLFDLLFLGELRAVVAWDLLLEPFAMRRRIELGRLLEAKNFWDGCSS